jgi:formylglycine-generating enzyme required for sulfatase activity
MNGKRNFLLVGVFCVSLSAGVFADSYTETMESAVAALKAARALLTAVETGEAAADSAIFGAAAGKAAEVAAVKRASAADSVATGAAAQPVKKVEKAPPPQPKPPRVHPIGKPDIDMVFVNGGKFKMGCRGDDAGCISDERPIHEVKVGDYYIGKYPVTQKQWASVMGINPSHFDGDGWENLPVEQVSWDEIQEFIRRLNVMTGKKYRLPTEAEWEYAVRGGTKGKGEKFFGHKFLDDVAWYDYNSFGRTQTVGGKKPNELGLHDMTGNVWEWVSDWYDKNYYKDGPLNGPKGPRNGTERVYRGGSFNAGEQHCRVTLRNCAKPGYKAIYLGFRLASSR